MRDAVKETEPFAGITRVCPVCGREFQYYGGWVYVKPGRGGKIVYCSWRCLRKDEKENPRNNQADRRDNIIQAIKDGLTTREICILLHEDPTRVKYWRDKLEKERRELEHETEPAGSQQADRGTGELQSEGICGY